MTIQMTFHLRDALNADAVVSGAAAVAMIAGASLVAPLTGLPSALLVGAGFVLIPFVASLVYLARKTAVSRLAIIDIVAINALWVTASFGLLVSGYIRPNWLGIAFVAVQATAVAVLAALQYVGLRRASIERAA